MKNVVLYIFLILVIQIGCKSDQSESGQSQSETGQKNKITYTIPDGWVSETPKSRMRRAQFRLPGPKTEEYAELAVFVFPGSGGSVNDNLNRWYRQFKQPDGADSEERAEIKKFRVNNLDVTVVYVTGTYLQSPSTMMMGGPVKEIPSTAMLAAIVETRTDPWFFKAVGPQDTIDHWRPVFNEFVQSFKWE